MNRSRVNFVTSSSSASGKRGVPNFACGPRSFPVGIHYWGNTGDRGFVPVRRGDYRIALHRVAQRGEFIGGTVDCAWRPPARFGFQVSRPWHGNTVWRTI